MTKEECIRKIAHRRYEIRQVADLPGDADTDWRYANYAFSFLDDVDATKDTEWQLKMSDYDIFMDIWEAYIGGTNG